MSTSKPAPVLKQFAGQWTMTHQPSKEKEWTLEERFKQAKKEGFDAIAGGPNAAVPPLCEKYGIDYVCYIDGNANYKARLLAAKESKPARINVQLLDHDTLPKDAVKVWLKLEAEAEKLGLNVDLEVHRDTSTETPEKVYEIADLYKKETGKKLRFCFDFSHIAVVKHLAPPFAERLLVRPDLVQLSRQVHFRPFNGHHCQGQRDTGVQGLPRVRRRVHRLLVQGRERRRGALRLSRVRTGARRLRLERLPERVEGRGPAARQDRGDLEG